MAVLGIAVLLLVVMPAALYGVAYVTQRRMRPSDALIAASNADPARPIGKALPDRG